jgi:hypothetical protein
MAMETSKTYFNIIGAYTAYAAKWIIYLGRKYPLFAAVHLALSIWFLFFFGSGSTRTSLPPPAPPVSTNPPSSFTPSSSNPISSTDTVVSVAQAQAFKNGNEITIRWNQPVQNVKLLADGRLLAATCQPTTCTAALSGQVERVLARWQEAGQNFEKTFRL